MREFLALEQAGGSAGVYRSGIGTMPLFVSRYDDIALVRLRCAEVPRIHLEDVSFWEEEIVPPAYRTDRASRPEVNLQPTNRSAARRNDFELVQQLG